MPVPIRTSTIKFMISIIIVASLTATVFTPIIINHGENITIKVELPKKELEMILENVSWTRLELQYHVTVKQYMYYHVPQTLALGFYTFSPEDPLADYITIRIPYEAIKKEEFQWIFSNRYKIEFSVSLRIKIINSTGVVLNDRTSWSKVYDPREFLKLFGQEIVIDKILLINPLPKFIENETKTFEIRVNVELPKEELEKYLANVSYTEINISYEVIIKYVNALGLGVLGRGYTVFSSEDSIGDYLTIVIPKESILRNYYWFENDNATRILGVKMQIELINETGSYVLASLKYEKECKVRDLKNNVTTIGKELWDLKFSLEKPPIELTIYVYEKSGEPLKEGTAYVWIGRPRNASFFVGGFEIESGTVRANIRELVEPILEEWREYIAEVKEPNQTFLWITIAYPGDIYSGMTILFDPIKALEKGGRLVKTIILPVDVDYSKPIPILVSG